jgi:hypothetical protein
LPLRLLGLRSTLRRRGFFLPALRPIGLALVPFLPIALCVRGYDRAEKQEGGGRAGDSYEFHDGGLLS